MTRSYLNTRTRIATHCPRNCTAGGLERCTVAASALQNPLPGLSSPAIMFAHYAAPCRKALGRMLIHPLGELRRAHQA